MTLIDDLIAAEARAREAVRTAICEHVDLDNAWPLPLQSALDRYAAVCRLAGRWEYCDLKNIFKSEVAAELARLMEGCP